MKPDGIERHLRIIVAYQAILRDIKDRQVTEDQCLELKRQTLFQENIKSVYCRIDLEVKRLRPHHLMLNKALPASMKSRMSILQRQRAILACWGERTFNHAANDVKDKKAFANEMEFLMSRKAHDLLTKTIENDLKLKRKGVSIKDDNQSSIAKFGQVVFENMHYGNGMAIFAAKKESVSMMRARTHFLQKQIAAKKYLEEHAYEHAEEARIAWSLRVLWECENPLKCAFKPKGVDLCGRSRTDTVPDDRIIVSSWDYDNDDNNIKTQQLARWTTTRSSSPEPAHPSGTWRETSYRLLASCSEWSLWDIRDARRIIHIHQTSTIITDPTLPHHRRAFETGAIDMQGEKLMSAVHRDEDRLACAYSAIGHHGQTKSYIRKRWVDDGDSYLPARKRWKSSV